GADLGRKSRFALAIINIDHPRRACEQGIEGNAEDGPVVNACQTMDEPRQPRGFIAGRAGIGIGLHAGRGPSPRLRAVTIGVTVASSSLGSAGGTSGFGSSSSSAI